ncbi:MAG: short-chain dehydrogenase [Myxococcales bacterium]|nr:short-chain dehydrogenase [Myxococcales bacterium]
MTGICGGRVVIVTGAGGGIGREHALEFARQGAQVVVNDLGTDASGGGRDGTSAQAVVDEIKALGGEAIADSTDVTDFAGCQALVQRVVETFGGLDVVVNNAGFLRDRMFVSCTEEEWDSVVGVHLKGHFCLSHHAAAYWRAESKAGRTRDARIINTSSGAGLLGSVAQAAYSAAKGGILSLGLVQAAELGRYGVTVNTICPAARTRMTKEAFPEMMAKPEHGFDAMDPANIAPLAVWLGSSQSAQITGRIFEVEGGMVALAGGYHRVALRTKSARWESEEIKHIIEGLLTEAPTPLPVYGT